MKFKIATLTASVFLLSAGAASAQWTGCGVGVGGSMQYALATEGSPLGFGSSGEKAGVTLNCDYRMNAFVLGGEANYDWFFGDLHSIGAREDFSLLGRLGVLTNKDNLLYAVAGWGRTSTEGPKIDSWRIGLGDEFRIPNSPIYLDMRALYIRYDEGDLCGECLGVKVDALEAGVRIKLKFGPGMFGGSGSIFSTEDYPVHGKGTDPKTK